jgi:hypothetical protein
MPCNRLTDFDKTVVAITEPIATVIAKSKLLIFEKLRLPANRVNSITAKYIPIAESTIANKEVLDASNHFSMF